MYTQNKKGFDIMNKIFVSLPMEEKSVANILHEQSQIKSACEKYFETTDNDICYSLEKCSLTFKESLTDLAKAFDNLSKADILILGKGWRFGKEGRALFTAARLYDIPIFGVSDSSTLYRIQNEPIVKLKDKELIALVEVLHLAVKGSYVIHADLNLGGNMVTEFTEEDVEFITM